MPLKTRTTKRRAVYVSAAARARWREVGPDAIPGCYIADDVLAELVGLPALLALSDAEETALRAALEGENAE